MSPFLNLCADFFGNLFYDLKITSMILRAITSNAYVGFSNLNFFSEQRVLRKKFLPFLQVLRKKKVIQWFIFFANCKCG